MSKELENLVRKIDGIQTAEDEGDDLVNKMGMIQAYADEQNKKLIAKIELLEACREYDASGENRPDGYIVPNHYTGQRIDEMNKPLNK